MSFYANTSDFSRPNFIELTDLSLSILTMKCKSSLWVYDIYLKPTIVSGLMDGETKLFNNGNENNTHSWFFYSPSLCRWEVKALFLWKNFVCSWNQIFIWLYVTTEKQYLLYILQCIILNISWFWSEWLSFQLQTEFLQVFLLFRVI